MHELLPVDCEPLAELSAYLDHGDSITGERSSTIQLQTAGQEESGRSESFQQR